MVDAVAKELQAARARLADLESSLVRERHQVLAGLHKQYGFGTVEEFLTAVKNASRGRATQKTKPAKAVKSAKAPTPAASKPGKRKRARITPEIKQKLKSLVKAGHPGTRIAKELGISLPSVQNIKRELGLVKARG